MVTIKITKKFRRGTYETAAWKKSELICGIDEVGRSCLAGPVIAAAAMLAPRAGHKYLRDSKELTPEQRLICYKWLQKRSVWGVGIMHSRIIDEVNIHHATIKAMKRALMQLYSRIHQRPSAILVDFVALQMPTLDIPIYHFIKGEQRSSSVAAASIIAKVTRDTLMKKMDALFPGYSWSQNKGYGTKLHREGLQRGGESIIHRKSFNHGIVQNGTEKNAPVDETASGQP